MALVTISGPDPAKCLFEYKGLINIPSAELELKISLLEKQIEALKKKKDEFLKRINELNQEIQQIEACKSAAETMKSLI